MSRERERLVREYIADMKGEEKITDLIMDYTRSISAAHYMHGDNIDERGEYGDTPLMDAAYADDIEAVQYLIDHGADVNSVEDLERMTPLMFCQSPIVAELLLAAGADINAISIYGTVLQTAIAYQRSPDLIRFFLEAGADVNEHGGGESPLMLATYGNQRDTMRLLVEYGADPFYSYRGKTVIEIYLRDCLPHDYDLIRLMLC